MSTLRARGWRLYDEIVASAPARDENPWRLADGQVRFEIDEDTLRRLLGVPVLLQAGSQSGVPALALDVWVAYELRRAGFDADRVWPRATAPRVLPGEIPDFITRLPVAERSALLQRIAAYGTGGGATANILGKNYVKQVDVVMSSWATGPELLVSTKRMDSSFGKNAANRVEESYGDAKNLRLRHPQAALGFVYALNAAALTQEPDRAAWLIDLLGKLGREDDAYDAVALLLPMVDGPAPEAVASAESPVTGATGATGPGAPGNEAEDVGGGADRPGGLGGSGFGSQAGSQGDGQVRASAETNPTAAARTASADVDDPAGAADAVDAVDAQPSRELTPGPLEAGVPAPFDDVLPGFAEWAAPSDKDTGLTERQAHATTAGSAEVGTAESASPTDRLSDLPAVHLLTGQVPRELTPGRFFEVMCARILDNSPINFHREARRRRDEATRR